MPYFLVALNKNMWLKRWYAIYKKLILVANPGLVRILEQTIVGEKLYVWADLYTEKLCLELMLRTLFFTGFCSSLFLF